MDTTAEGEGAAYIPDDDISWPLATSELKQQVRIRLGANGTAARLPETVLEAFHRTVSRIPNTTALYQKRPKKVRQTSDDDDPKK